MTTEDDRPADDPDPPESDIEWCYDAVGSVSRTFAITVDRLREPTARRICVGYLLCRVPDTVEDAADVPPGAKVDLLDCYDRVLDPADDTTVEAFLSAADPWVRRAEDRPDDWRVVANADRVLGAFRQLDDPARQAIRPQVRTMVGGMAEFVDRYAEYGGLRIQTVDELENYCEYVAGTVGTLVTDLVARDCDPERRQRLHDEARPFALLLQLVNVAKDVAADYRQENNVYMPVDWLREEDVDPETVADPENADAVGRTVRRLADHASGYLDGARRWLEGMPLTDGNTLAAWGVPYLLAVATLRELKDRPDDVVTEGDVKVTRAEVAAIVTQFDGDRRPEEIATLRDRIEREPLVPANQ